MNRTLDITATDALIRTIDVTCEKNRCIVITEADSSIIFINILTLFDDLNLHDDLIL